MNFITLLFSWAQLKGKTPLLRIQFKSLKDIFDNNFEIRALTFVFPIIIGGLFLGFFFQGLDELKKYWLEITLFVFFYWSLFICIKSNIFKYKVIFYKDDFRFSSNNNDYTGSSKFLFYFEQQKFNAIESFRFQNENLYLKMKPLYINSHKILKAQEFAIKNLDWKEQNEIKIFLTNKNILQNN